MAYEAKPGFVVNQGKIALALSIITLLTFGYQGAKYFIDRDYRISSLEEKWVSMEGTQREVAVELRNLNVSITDLNLVLREIQVRQGSH